MELDASYKMLLLTIPCPPNQVLSILRVCLSPVTVSSQVESSAAAHAHAEGKRCDLYLCYIARC